MFDQFYNYAIVSEEPTLKYQFTTNSGQQYIVMFLDYRVLPPASVATELAAEFALVNNDGTLDRTLTVETESAESFKIHATVVEIMKQAVSKTNISYLTFCTGSDEPTRTKLYDSWVDRLSDFFPGWHLKDTVDIQNNTFKKYILEKDI